jgi:hypothetical protein
VLYKNDSDESRLWPSISTSDGSTLELAPGEEAELDLPEGFEDEYLKPAGAKAVPASPPTVIAQERGLIDNVGEDQ